VTTQVTPLDALNANYSHLQYDFAPHTGTASSSPSSSFVSNTATLGWTRTITPYLAGSVGGGLIVIDPGVTTYAVNATIRLNTDNNSATLNYARSAFPSFVGIGVPLISDVVTLSAIQRLALNWELNETAGFSHSSGGSGATTTKYETYFGGVDLYYWITRIWSVALSFDYMNYHTEFGTSKSFFDRYASTLSLKATFN
jgi:hypothetical protein